MEYKELLKKAVKEMPAVVFERARFEIPKASGRIEGNKTVISNFTQIAETLRRPQAHLLKYLLKQLATPGEISGNRLVFGRKVSASQINAKIKEYALRFVLCPKCGKPDTEIKQESGRPILTCSACGHKEPAPGY